MRKTTLAVILLLLLRLDPSAGGWDEHTTHLRLTHDLEGKTLNPSTNKVPCIADFTQASGFGGVSFTQQEMNSIPLTRAYREDASLDRAASLRPFDVVIIGSGREDGAKLNATRHFYQPNTGKGIRLNFLGIPLGSGIAATVWGYDHFRNLEKGHSYVKCMQYAFDALAGPSKEDRKKGHLLLYLTTGHLAHLAEDLCQCEHSRDDAHPFDPAIEKRAERLINPGAFRPDIKGRFDNAEPRYPLPLGTMYASEARKSVKSFWVTAATFSHNHFLSTSTIWLSDLQGLNEFTGPASVNTNLVALKSTLESCSNGQGQSFYLRHNLISDLLFEHRLAVVKPKVIQRWCGWNTKKLKGQNAKRPDDLRVRSGDMSLDDPVIDDMLQQEAPKIAHYTAGLINYIFRLKLRGSFIKPNPDEEVYKVFVHNVSNCPGIPTEFLTMRSETTNPEGAAWLLYKQNLATGVRTKVHALTVPSAIAPDGQGVSDESFVFGVEERKYQYSVVFSGLAGPPGITGEGDEGFATVIIPPFDPPPSPAAQSPDW